MATLKKVLPRRPKSHKIKSGITPHARHQELDNLINGGLMRKVTSPEMEEDLVRRGMARKAVGGIVATQEGMKIFYGK